MEPDGDAPPFWSYTPNRRRPPPYSSPLLNPLVLILAIPILFIAFFFFLPPFLSHTNQILRPNSVKKSWDSINVLLVLFAILCGVFARRNEDAPPPEDDRRCSDGVPAPANLVTRPRQVAPVWLDFPDRKEYNRISSSVSDGGRLRRSSSSYPDLRQESLWESGGSRNRFFDDFEVNFYRSPPRETLDSSLTRRRHTAEREVEEPIVREIPVDKFEISSAPPPTPPKSASPPPPPPPPPPPAAMSKKRRSVHSVGRHRKEAEISENRRTAPAPAPPPAPPPPPSSSSPLPDLHSPVEKHESIVRKKSGATKDFATAIASLYKSGQRKRKKRTKSTYIYESAPQNSSLPSVTEPRSTPPPSPPPPPPPPPIPPSKVLQNFFKKSSKSKRVHSVPTTSAQPPPPPPPPPPNSIFNNLFKTGSRSRRFEKSYTSTTSPPPPPPPPPSSILNSIFADSKSRRFKTIPLPPPAPSPPRRPRQSNAGRPPKPTNSVPQYHHEPKIAPPSPLIPPPPPPPPFRVKEMTYVTQGDFVRIISAQSSRCSSPDREDADIMSVKSDGGDSVGPSSIYCPSPDVNVKADTFIARLRDEWRLEKMNSMKEKQKLH